MKRQIDMCNGSILPQLLKLTFPMMLSSVLQLLFNAADMVVVGNFAGENSLAAVGSTAPLVNLMTNLFLGLSVGANVITSRFIGQKDDEKVNRAVHTSIAISIISGIILTVIGIISAEKLLMLMGSPENVLPLSAKYLRCYFCGMTAMMIYNFGSSLLRSKGDTRRPLYYLTFAGVINVLLNLLFVIVLKMNAAGVGLATAISQCFSAACIIRCLMKENDSYHLELKKIIPDRIITSNILRVGIPAGFQGVVFSLSNVVIQSSINSFNSDVMAGSAAAASIEGFIWVSMNSFSQSALTFTSQNIGAGKYSRLTKITVISCACSAITGIVFGNLAYIFGPQLISIYNTKPEVISAGLIRMLYVCCFYCTCGLMDTIVGNIRGLGFAVTPTIVSLLGACGLRILWIFTIFRIPEYHTEQMLFISYPISWITTFIIHLICYCFIRRKMPKKDDV